MTTVPRRSTCPACKIEATAASSVQDERVPKPGDYSICAACGELSEFTEDGMRLLTREEYLQALKDNPELSLAMQHRPTFYITDLSQIEATRAKVREGLSRRAAHGRPPADA